MFQATELNLNKLCSYQIRNAFVCYSKKDTTVEFDLKKATSKTSFVGKDSAV